MNVFEKQKLVCDINKRCDKTASNVSDYGIVGGIIVVYFNHYENIIFGIFNFSTKKEYDVIEKDGVEFYVYIGISKKESEKKIDEILKQLSIDEDA